MKKIFSIIALLLLAAAVHAQQATTKKYIKVHFLYGSKPAKAYKAEERSWFGGMLGGHVGIETDSGRIFNFTPRGTFHVFTHKKPRKRHSHFTYHDKSSFYSILGGPADSNKQLCVTIPLTEEQYRLLDTLQKKYLAQTPYDYAFFGYRCGAAAYDVLSRLGILKKYNHRKTYMKIFYPKKLRKRLIKKAAANGWKMERKEGTKRRKWEGD